MLRRVLAAAVLVCAIAGGDVPAGSTVAHRSSHTFAFGADDFVLDGKPFQMISCELHPARIPVEYWRHRIRMAHAMGCNTIAMYIFWNYHERSEAQFDFSSGNRDIGQFLRIAQDEGLWVLLRPGPYVCAEWDFGGIPAYLLSDPGLKIRCLNPHYMTAVERYIHALAREIRPLLAANGGPILMLQIENEYGSYGNDRAYLAKLREIWESNGVKGPFYTADGPTPYMLEAGSLPGAAVGLDSGTDDKQWALARSINPGVPIFSSETYPGWLTHWGEPWARPGVADLLKEVTFLLTRGKSFNLYVAHGGTNFGFTAGANSGGKGFQPDVTSYDYDAPIDEQGRATPKYQALRELIASSPGLQARPALAVLPSVPDPIPAIAVPQFQMQRYASIWDDLPAPIAAVQPQPFEMYGQNQGLMLYRTSLVGRKAGHLAITDLHDFATVFLDGTLVGTIDRRLGQNSIDLPQTSTATPTLDILVEGMGHINFASAMIDRKGITDRVTLSGMTLMNWQVFPLPLHEPPAPGLKTRPASDPPGSFFRGTFTLDTVADTYIDVTGYQKGVVWVNGHNLGRYWDIGPQMRLYCPAPWLRRGANDVVVFDLLATAAAPLRGVAALR
jgi:beta-galactosidase